MAHASDEADVCLAGARHVEDREVLVALEDRAKLIESTAFPAERGTRVLVAEMRKDTLTGTKFHGS